MANTIINGPKLLEDTDEIRKRCHMTWVQFCAVADRSPNWITEACKHNKINTRSFNKIVDVFKLDRQKYVVYDEEQMTDDGVSRYYYLDSFNAEAFKSDVEKYLNDNHMSMHALETMVHIGHYSLNKGIANGRLPRRTVYAIAGRTGLNVQDYIFTKGADEEKVEEQPLEEQKEPTQTAEKSEIPEWVKTLATVQATQTERTANTLTEIKALQSQNGTAINEQLNRIANALEKLVSMMK